MSCLTLLMQTIEDRLPMCLTDLYLWIVRKTFKAYFVMVTERVEPNLVCNLTSDNKIGRPRSGSSICLSRLYDTKSKERNARMLLSNVKHWKAKQMFFSRILRHCLFS